MTAYRHHLPPLDGGSFITDGGLETSLIFLEGIDLPCFAAFTLLADETGRRRLADYYRRYLEIARSARAGFVLESPTWRANPDWAGKLGYDAPALAAANKQAIDLMQSLRSEYEVPGQPVLISGCIGPRGDGYRPDQLMSTAEAQDYHRAQIEVFAVAGADLITGVTINYLAEAEGIVRAAQAAGMPSVISFTVETDGRLPTGESLAMAIQAVDEATDAAPAYYMINCAHPSHFVDSLKDGDDWRLRIRGVRANASKCSHAELDAATELDDGDPAELAAEYRLLQQSLPNLNVFGGCCGTDHRHVAAIAGSCLSRGARAVA